jgi:integrase
VFGNEVGEELHGIKRAWAIVCDAAGITDLHFHDLRREFGSRLLERVGGNPAIVRDCLGHANLNTTNRYLVTRQAADPALPRLPAEVAANSIS